MERIEIYERIFSALNQGTIEGVLKAAYEVLQMPVTVSDSTFVILGKYPNALTGDRQWDANQVGKQISTEYINKFQQDKHWLILTESEGVAYINWGYFKDYPRYSSFINNRNRVVGYFAALATNVERQEWHEEAIKVISQALSIAMELENKLKMGKDMRSEIMFHGLLSGEINTEEDFNNIQAFSESTIKPGFVLLAVKTREKCNSPLESYLGKEWTNQYKGVIETILDDCLYILLSNVEEGFFKQSRFSETIKSLKANDAVCGISRIFNNLFPLQDYKWQAEMALKIGNKLHPQRTIYHYDTYVLEIMAYTAIKNISPANYIHPAIFKLAEYDSQHNTSYLDTLEVYASNLFDNAATIENLCIHRNTLLYRLGKIKEITGIDLLGGDTGFHILLSFCYLRMRDRFK